MSGLSKLCAVAFGLWGLLHIAGGGVILTAWLRRGADAAYAVYGYDPGGLPGVAGDVLGLSAREAATVLGISDSVLRHRLAARAAMQDRFEGLCALVSKQGICHQCAGLRMLNPGQKPAAPFPDVSEYAERAAITRAARPGSMAGLHAVFWRRTKIAEERGLCATKPGSGCGESPDAGTSTAN